MLQTFLIVITFASVVLTIESEDIPTGMKDCIDKMIPTLRRHLTDLEECNKLVEYRNGEFIFDAYQQCRGKKLVTIESGLNMIDCQELGGSLSEAQIDAAQNYLFGVMMSGH